MAVGQLVPPGQPVADGELAVMAGDGLVIRAADAAVPDLPPGSGTAAALRVAIVPTVAPIPSGATVPGPTSTPTSAPGSDVQPWAGPRLLSLAPEAVATAWLSALLVRRDWTTLWSTTDANLRLATAQQWPADLDRTGDNVTAWSLAAEVPHLGMWGPFAERQFTRWATELGADPGSGGGAPLAAGRHRPARIERPDAGRELCTVSISGATDRSWLTLRLRDRWRVAGLGRGALQPGWPTRWLPLDESLDDLAGDAAGPDRPGGSR